MALKGKKPSLVTKPKKCKVCVFGKPGVGKTFGFSLEFPKVYYIDSEAGANFPHYLEKLENNGGAYMGIDDGASDFATVIAELRKLATEKHQYETVAITLSKLWGNELAKAQEKNPTVTNDYGAFKKPAIAYMRQLMNWINRIDMHVVLEAHEMGEWETVNGERTEVGQIPDYYIKFDHELDLTLRMISTPANVIPYCIVKKSRVQNFLKGERFLCSMPEIKERFGDIVEWTPPKPIEMATPEQIAELHELLGTIVISDKEKDKILSKACASTWGELNKEQTQATIEWLKGKIK